jgi:hypothetical protein
MVQPKKDRDKKRKASPKPVNTSKQQAVLLEDQKVLLDKTAHTLQEQTVLLANLIAKHEVLEASHNKLQKVNAAVVVEVNELKKQNSTKKKKTVHHDLQPALNLLRDAIERWRQSSAEKTIFQVNKGSRLDDVCIQEDVQTLYDRLQVCVTM